VSDHWYDSTPAAIAGVTLPFPLPLGFTSVGIFRFFATPRTYDGRSTPPTSN
jgi:hypothetical protein